MTGQILSDSFDGLPFAKGEAVEARFWPPWDPDSVTVRGVIVGTHPSHIDIDVSYASREVKFYPGKSAWWEGNICRVESRCIYKRRSALEALGEAAG